MLKIIKMISLYFLATAVCESTSLTMPPQLLQNQGPMHRVTVTAYTTDPRCTANSHYITSSSAKIHPRDYEKLIALSSDIARRYEFGDSFSLWTRGKIYVVAYEDRMPKKHKKKVDLLLPSYKSCQDFGRQPGILIPLERT